MSRFLLSLLALNTFLVGCAGSSLPVLKSTYYPTMMSPENFVAYTNQKQRDPEMEALFCARVADEKTSKTRIGHMGNPFLRDSLIIFNFFLGLQN